MLTLHLDPSHPSNKWIHPLLNSVSAAYNLRTVVLDYSAATPCNHSTFMHWSQFDQDITRLRSSGSLKRVLVKGISWRNQGLCGPLFEVCSDFDRNPVLWVLFVEFISSGFFLFLFLFLFLFAYKLHLPSSIFLSYWQLSKLSHLSILDFPAFGHVPICRVIS